MDSSEQQPPHSLWEKSSLFVAQAVIETARVLPTARMRVGMYQRALSALDQAQTHLPEMSEIPYLKGIVALEIARNVANHRIPSEWTPTQWAWVAKEILITHVEKLNTPEWLNAISLAYFYSVPSIELSREFPLSEISQTSLACAHDYAERAHLKNPGNPLLKYDLARIKIALGEQSYVAALLKSAIQIYYGERHTKLAELLDNPATKPSQLAGMITDLDFWLHCAYDIFFANGLRGYDAGRFRQNIRLIKEAGVWFPATDAHRITYLLLPGGSSTAYRHRPTPPEQPHPYIVE